MNNNWRENLSALPDIYDLEHRIEMLPNGSTITHRIVPKFITYMPVPDDPIMFTDKEGTWLVVYNIEGGPDKRWIFLL